MIKKVQLQWTGAVASITENTVGIIIKCSTENIPTGHDLRGRYAMLKTGGCQVVQDDQNIHQATNSW